MEQKKNIANKTAGLAEKHHNNQHVCKVFTTFAEAQYYQIKYNGRIYSLQQQHLHDGMDDMSNEDSINEYENKRSEKDLIQNIN